MEIDRGMWKRYENISASCHLVVSTRFHSFYLFLACLMCCMRPIYTIWQKHKSKWGHGKTLKTLHSLMEIFGMNSNRFAGVCEHGNYILKVKRAICASQGASTRLPLTDKQVVQLKRHTSGWAKSWQKSPRESNYTLYLLEQPIHPIKKHLPYFPDYEAPPDPGHSLSSEKQREREGTLAQVKG